MSTGKNARIPFDPSKWPFFYGWFIILLGTLGILMSIPGQTIGVSTFTDSLIEVLAINRDQISLAYMLGTILSSFLLTKAGRLYDSYGARIVGGIGSVGLGLSLIVLSQVDKIIISLGAFGKVMPVIIIMVVGFGFIRFFGQGVLTLVSRTMMMKWFDARRGFATSFSSVFTALGFSMAPVYLELLIQEFDWNGAWMAMGVAAAFVFPIVIFIFFRNSPTDVGLLPDGGKLKKQTKRLLFPVVKEFSLSEVRGTLVFWVFALFLAMQAFYITGFTFHVVSIFETVNMERSEAIDIFKPIAVISVVSSLVFGWLSDHIKLNYLLYSKGISAFMGVVGLMLLGQYEFAIYLLILGTGLMTGLFGVISTVSWPRLYGKLHLGAISGFCMTIIVFGSALGPMLFSLSESQTGNYQFAGGFTLALILILTFLATRIVNPQIALNKENNQSTVINE